MTYTDAEFNLAYKEILERVLVNKTPSSAVKMDEGEFVIYCYFLLQSFQVHGLQVFRHTQGGFACQFPSFQLFALEFQKLRSFAVELIRR